jgi:hypothetical protein
LSGEPEQWGGEYTVIVSYINHTTLSENSFASDKSFYCFILELFKRASVAKSVYDHRLDDKGSILSIGKEDLSPSPCDQTGSGAHRGSFQRG